jgi:hypothetical protein|tara:strand:- start:19392 stop:19742 length:351 start_codon:yes stop_codon:yes gene_type:complete
MKATISRTQLDIDYKCPNCYLHFRLSNQDIPQESDIVMTCPECWDSVTIPAYNKSNNKNKQLENKTTKLAIQALHSQGYTLLEATRLVHKYDRQNITVVELIKEAIKDEQSTTTTI